MRLSVGELVDRLSIVNIKISLLEGDIRKGKEGELGLEEVGRRALEIRDLNRERVALKNALNEFLDPTAFNDVKVNHASGGIVRRSDAPRVGEQLPPPSPWFTSGSLTISDQPLTLISSVTPVTGFNTTPWDPAWNLVPPIEVDIPALRRQTRNLGRAAKRSRKK